MEGGQGGRDKREGVCVCVWWQWLACCTRCEVERVEVQLVAEDIPGVVASQVEVRVVAQADRTTLVGLRTEQQQ